MKNRLHLLPAELEKFILLDTLSPILLFIIFGAAIAQPVTYSAFMFMLSSSPLLAILGFMSGCLGLGFWMAYEGGIFKVCSQQRGKCHCRSRIFWVFIAPVLPVLALAILVFLHILNNLSQHM